MRDDIGDGACIMIWLLESDARAACCQDLLFFGPGELPNNSLVYGGGRFNGERVHEHG